MARAELPDYSGSTTIIRPRASIVFGFIGAEGEYLGHTTSFGPPQLSHILLCVRCGDTYGKVLTRNKQRGNPTFQVLHGCCSECDEAQGSLMFHPRIAYILQHSERIPDELLSYEIGLLEGVTDLENFTPLPYPSQYGAMI